MNHSVTVIIPTYNNKAYIETAIQSILDQTYDNVECIVIDDGSTDGTQEILSDLILHNKIEYFYQENKGVSSARNLGIKKANGEYLLFLDADDLLKPNGVADLMKCIIRNNSDMSVGLAENELAINTKFPYGKNHLANLLSNWWPVSSVMLRKNEICWNEQMKTWEVIDYFSSALVKGLKCTICPNVITSINHTVRTDRATYLYDHYNSLNTFNYFENLKQKILSRGKMDKVILEVLDKHLLSNAYSMYKESQQLPILDKIKTSNLKTYSWFKPLGISGFCSLLGLKRGIKLFYFLNRLLGRA
ncbi:glycosyltransferase family 2 protein [Pedobacter miscanthi]|uniref:Glycosyltransferase 2-like domain-containing protein n=1 Tax=Pedobacter miscanthi TaxID=2259170 RepID=A0A366L821_9SPHI|nr:glycosyltransferase family A protein [Pedobacter miscanthi]RBQ10006.1 hypothetical protein DRW42_06095 [Pedobacter miscanthi]